MSAPSVVSKLRPLQQYNWGDNCRAFTLSDNGSLNVKLESMPSGAEEVLHFHNHAQQFFYILKGNAAFEVDGITLIVHEGEGLTIAPRRNHRIMNKEEKPLEFIVISQPSMHNDRHNLI